MRQTPRLTLNYSFNLLGSQIIGVLQQTQLSFLFLIFNKKTLDFIFILNYVYVLLGGHVNVSAGAPWRLKSWLVLSCLTWVWGTELESSARAVGVHNC